MAAEVQVLRTRGGSMGDEEGVRPASLRDAFFNGAQKEKVNNLISKSEHLSKSNHGKRRSTGTRNSLTKPPASAATSRLSSRTMHGGETTTEEGEFQFRRHRTQVPKSRSTPEGRRSSTASGSSRGLSSTEHGKSSTETSEPRRSFASSRRKMGPSSAHRSRGTKSPTKMARGRERSRSKERTRSKSGERVLTRSALGSNPSEGGRGDRKAGRKESRTSVPESPRPPSPPDAPNSDSPAQRVRERVNRRSQSGVPESPIPPPPPSDAPSDSPGRHRDRVSRRSRPGGPGSPGAPTPPDAKNNDSPHQRHRERGHHRSRSRRKIVPHSPRISRGQQEVLKRHEELVRSPGSRRRKQVTSRKTEKASLPAEMPLEDAVADDSQLSTPLQHEGQQVSVPQIDVPFQESTPTMVQKETVNPTVAPERIVGLGPGDTPRFSKAEDYNVLWQRNNKRATKPPMTPGSKLMSSKEVREQSERLAMTDLGLSRHGKKGLLGKLIGKKKIKVFKKLADGTESAVDLEGDSNEAPDGQAEEAVNSANDKSTFEQLNSSILSFDMDLAVPFGDKGAKSSKPEPRSLFQRAASSRAFSTFGTRKQSLSKLGEYDLQPSGSFDTSQIEIPKKNKRSRSFGEKGDSPSTNSLANAPAMSAIAETSFSDMNWFSDPFDAHEETLEHTDDDACSTQTVSDPSPAEKAPPAPRNSESDAMKEGAGKLDALLLGSQDQPIELGNVAKENGQSDSTPTESNGDGALGTPLSSPPGRSSLPAGGSPQNEAGVGTLEALLSGPNTGTRGSLPEPSVCEPPQMDLFAQLSATGNTRNDLEGHLVSTEKSSPKELPEPSVCDTGNDDEQPTEDTESTKSRGKLGAHFFQPAPKCRSKLQDLSICEESTESIPWEGSNPFGEENGKAEKEGNESVADDETVCTRQFLQLTLPGMNGYESSSSLNIEQFRSKGDARGSDALLL